MANATPSSKKTIDHAASNRTNLPNVYTFSSPPPGLDLNDADRRVLRQYGIPPQPNAKLSPKAARIWKEMVGRNFRRVSPVLLPRPEQKTYPKRAAGRAAAGTSLVWSGGLLTPPSALQLVFGQWVVPAITPPSSSGTADGDWWTVAWVGLDGSLSADVLQAGTAQHVSRSGGDVTTEYFAWYEWYTDSWVEFLKFDIEPGDTVAVLVTYDGKDAKGTEWGTGTISNVTRGTVVSASFSAPVGVTFKGDSAEWIMERPQFSGVAADLPEYGEIVFTNCIACSANATFDSTAATAVDMMDGTTTLSTGTLESDWKCVFVAS